MCIGIPMQIKETGFGTALCEGMGLSRRVETLLVGDQPVGTWILVFLESAREVLSEEDAMKISSAVQAVDMIMGHQGNISTDGLAQQNIEALFADLIDREPQKPESLIALEKQQREARGE